jgi:hypothetical protein
MNAFFEEARKPGAMARHGWLRRAGQGLSPSAADTCRLRGRTRHEQEQHPLTQGAGTPFALAILGGYSRYALAWRAWKSREIRTFPGRAEQSSGR